MLLGFHSGESLGLTAGHLGESPMKIGESLRKRDRGRVTEHLIAHYWTIKMCPLTYVFFM